MLYKETDGFLPTSCDSGSIAADVAAVGDEGIAASVKVEAGPRQEVITRLSLGVDSSAEGPTGDETNCRRYFLRKNNREPPKCVFEVLKLREIGAWPGGASTSNRSSNDRDAAAGAQKYGRS